VINSRASHFISLTLALVLVTAFASLFSLPLLGFLSTATSVMGALSNFALISAVLAPLAMLIGILLRSSGAKKKIRWKQVISNIGILSLVVLAFNYGFIAFFYNWPSSLLRTIPESFENRGISLGISLGFTAISIFTWVVWLIWVGRPGKGREH